MSLRSLLRAVLPTDADLEAFCLDCFKAVHDRFADGMDRERKINLLLSSEDHATIAAALWRDHEEAVRGWAIREIERAPARQIRALAEAGDDPPRSPRPRGPWMIVLASVLSAAVTATGVLLFVGSPRPTAPDPRAIVQTSAPDARPAAETSAPDPGPSRAPSGGLAAIGGRDWARDAATLPHLWPQGAAWHGAGKPCLFLFPIDDPLMKAFRVDEEARSKPHSLQLVFRAAPGASGGWGIGCLGGYDASRFTSIEFFAWAEPVPARFKFKLKDTAGKEPAVDVTIERKGWRLVTIPLNRFVGVNLAALENFNVGFDDKLGSVAIYLDDFEFTR